MKVYTYRTDGGKDLIKEFIKNLPKNERAEGFSIIRNLREKGYGALKLVTTRQIEGKLWEIKFRRHNRLFYAVLDSNGIYIVHACKKQKGKTEKKDLDKARERIRKCEVHNAF
ncbi:MAG: type II toxin-antitoxin system RelE/ParE family toxin [Clostridiales bacterium]|nr:type II toxin-antitoxin system RelE/ParE family toxin [Clostridiales bacterium]